MPEQNNKGSLEDKLRRLREERLNLEEKLREEVARCRPEKEKTGYDLVCEAWSFYERFRNYEEFNVSKAVKELEKCYEFSVRNKDKFPPDSGFVEMGGYKIIGRILSDKYWEIITADIIRKDKVDAGIVLSRMAKTFKGLVFNFYTLMELYRKTENANSKLIECAKTATERDPNDYGAWLALGTLDKSNSFNAFKRYWELTHNPHSSYLLGKELSMQGNYEAALTALIYASKNKAGEQIHDISSENSLEKVDTNWEINVLFARVDSEEYAAKLCDITDNLYNEDNEETIQRLEKALKVIKSTDRKHDSGVQEYMTFDSALYLAPYKVYGNNCSRRKKKKIEKLLRKKLNVNQAFPHMPEIVARSEVDNFIDAYKKN